MWKFWVFWHKIMWFFYWKKLICPKILFFISIRPINLSKMVKENYYNSPDNAAYASTKRNRKLGKEYCVALVTVRNDLEEQLFFNYGYHKENFKVLYSTRKLMVPNSFKTTILWQHKLQYEGGPFDEQKFSKLFFYLPTTVDTKEKINMYFTSVHLKQFHVNFWRKI